MGANHTCALTDAGGVKCWGWNKFGQLGDGTNSDRSTPVDVLGLSSGVIAIAVGAGHTCALTSMGGVKCWGWNFNGQLGDGTNLDHNTPVDVYGLTSGVTSISAGTLLTCAITNASGVKCWGWNFFRQIDNDTTIDHTTPVDISGVSSGITAIAVGDDYTCALTSVGSVKCWGLILYNHVAKGTTVNLSSPVDVSGLTSGVTTITAGGYHACALMNTGGVKCWGQDNYGQLGDGTNTDSNTPIDVPGLTSGVIAITAGEYHTCAITSAGVIKCWGNNDYGQLGFSSGHFSAPKNVVGF